MNFHRKDSRQTTTGPTSAARDLDGRKKGFTRLDPSTMGLDMPEWLTSSPTTEQSSTTSYTGIPCSSPILPQPARETLPEMSAQPRTLLEGMKVVCICKGIKKSVFWKVLDAGACTKEEVNRMTGSGSGGCQGRRCGPRIMDMLRDFIRSK